MNSTSHQVYDQKSCPECGSTDFQYDTEITCRTCGLVLAIEPMFLNIPDRNQACLPIQFKHDTIHSIGNDSERRNSHYEYLAQLDAQTTCTTLMNNERTAKRCFNYLVDFYGNKRLVKMEDLLELFNYLYAELPVKSRCRNPEALALAVYTKAYAYFNTYLTPVDPTTQKCHFDVSFSTYSRICIAVRMKIIQYLDAKYGKNKSAMLSYKYSFPNDEAGNSEFQGKMEKIIHLDSSFYHFIAATLIKNKHRAEFGKKGVQRYAVVTGIVLYKLGLLPTKVHMNYLAKSAHMNQDNLKRLIMNLADSSFTDQFDDWVTQNQETADLWIQSFVKVKLRIPCAPRKSTVEKFEPRINSSAEIAPEIGYSTPLEPEINIVSPCIPELCSETIIPQIASNLSLNISTEIAYMQNLFSLGSNINPIFNVSRFIDIEKRNFSFIDQSPFSSHFSMDHLISLDPTSFRGADGPPPWG